jgi:hypothetical protein
MKLLTSELSNKNGHDHLIYSLVKTASSTNSSTNLTGSFGAGSSVTTNILLMQKLFFHYVGTIILHLHIFKFVVDRVKGRV